VRIVFTYAVAGVLTGCAFWWITTRPGVVDHLSYGEGKHSTPTYGYWIFLGVSLAAAAVLGTAGTYLTHGERTSTSSTTFRSFLALLLLAASVPSQAATVLTKWELDGQIRLISKPDIVALCATATIALAAFLGNRFVHWPSNLNLPLLVAIVGVLVVLPTGITALFVAGAVSIYTRKWSSKFALTIALTLLMVYLLSALVSIAAGISLFAIGLPLAEAVVCVLLALETHPDVSVWRPLEVIWRFRPDNTK
jgi:hypothetical protein